MSNNEDLPYYDLSTIYKPYVVMGLSKEELEWLVIGLDVAKSESQIPDEVADAIIARLEEYLGDDK